MRKKLPPANRRDADPAVSGAVKATMPDPDAKIGASYDLPARLVRSVAATALELRCGKQDLVAAALVEFLARSREEQDFAVGRLGVKRRKG